MARSASITSRTVVLREQVASRHPTAHCFISIIIFSSRFDLLWISTAGFDTIFTTTALRCWLCHTNKTV